MANAYKGEIEIELYRIKYPMLINIDVISEFQSETGECFMELAMKAINAVEKVSYLKQQSRDNGTHFSFTDAAVIMTGAVSMKNAAHLFYIAAHKMSKTVEFEEIQEAVLLEGPAERVIGEEGDEVLLRSYPMLFAEFVAFAVMGVPDTVKKEKSETLEASVS